MIRTYINILQPKSPHKPFTYSKKKKKKKNVYTSREIERERENGDLGKPSEVLSSASCSNCSRNVATYYKIHMHILYRNWYLFYFYFSL